MHTIPGVDVAARNGGDEFCAILHDVQKIAAIERAHKLCRAVREFDFGAGFPITASIGVAAFPYDAGSANELLEVADAAMYHSKRSGRDRVSFAVDRGTYAAYEQEPEGAAQAPVKHSLPWLTCSPLFSDGPTP
jgi:diguanylate cyclase (GGDEF)-like protein